MNRLVHVVYASTATTEFGVVELAEMLRRARQKNERLGLTGMLLYTKGSFFQVLEGEGIVVEAMFDTIGQDPRHQKVVELVCEPIARRSFGEWTMGSPILTRSEIATISGFNDFFDDATCFDQLDGGRAKKLLAAFGEGRWRARIDGGAPAATQAASYVHAGD